ncbi:MAG: NAD(P)/FAD-dependent oxidoreductase [Desulfurococcales archaeon]|nr:NAD(P)/FAD-dependent oxidoreductase [Desulfurococcales archaeon]
MDPPIIIGGGFAGLSNAYFIQGSTLYEEHDKVGFPQHCTGLVSRRVIKILGSLAEETILGYYKRIVIKDLELKTLSILNVREGVYRVDRVKLENLLKEEAENRGSLIMMNKKILDINASSKETCISILDYYDHDVKKTCFSNRIIVIADGVTGFISRRFSKKSKDLYLGLQGFQEKGSYHIDPEEIIVFVDDRIFPGYFGWAIPVSERKMLIGGAWPLKYRDKRRLMKLFTRILMKKSVIKDEKIYNMFGGLINRDFDKTFHKPNIVLAGDSAGFVKPFTGGGLYTSLYQVLSIKNSLDRASEYTDFENLYIRHLRPIISQLYLQRKFTELTYKIGLERFVRNILRISDIFLGIEIDYDYYILPRSLNNI